MTNEHYGGFWRRLPAFMIDKTIVYALSINISVIALFAVGLGNDIMTILQVPPEEISRRIGAFVFLCFFLSLLIDMTYFTWFHGVNGQTPGKMLLRLRVINVSGEPLTPGTAFLRWVGYLISGLFFSLGFLWIAFDRRKQGWHDKIALTLVIRLETPASVIKENITDRPPLPASSDIGCVSASTFLPSPSAPPDSKALPSEEGNKTDALTDQQYFDQESGSEKWLDK